MKALQLKYQKGRIPFTACRYDPRFSYCLYVPRCQQANPAHPLPLVAVIHGSSRTAESYRDSFIEFAEAQGVIVLVPLFPIGLPQVGDADGYKLQVPSQVQFDRLLLEMVDEVAARYVVQPQFSLYGFSGGAQFAHRFFYLHPQRLQALVVAAPGQVTLPDQSHRWSRGVEDMAVLFGRALDLEAMRQVPVQLVVGAADTETIVAGAEETTRLALTRSLYASFRALNMAVEFEQVPDVAHQGYDLLPASQRFLARALGSGDTQVNG